MAKKFKLTQEEADGFVSIVNNLIQAYCDKYPEEHNFDEESIGFTDDGEIMSDDGDDLTDTLEWVNSEIIPDLLS